MRISVRPLQISHTGQITLTTVAVASFIRLATTVIPIERTGRFTSHNRSIAVGLVKGCMNGLTRQAIECSKEFIPTINFSATIIPILCIIGILDGINSSCFTHISSQSILAARSSLTHHFGKTVSIEVVNHILGIVGSRTDIGTQVNAPQFRRSGLCPTSSPIHLVAINIDIAGLSTVRIVLRVGGVPLDEYLVLPITIHIAYRTVVGRIGTTTYRIWLVEMQLIEKSAPRLNLGSSVNSHSVHLGHNLITACIISRGIVVAGHVFQARLDNRPVSQHIKRSSPLIISA